ncbi:MAG: protein BatD, partial [Rhodanobacteraceae bacterium]
FVLWLATLALWWRSRPRQVVVAPNEPLPSGASAHRAAFLRAAALGELAGAERALVAWARNEKPDVRNLGELSHRLDDVAQRDALAALQKARYAGGSTEGIGSQLERAFKRGIAWTRATTAPKHDSVLPGLYRD